MGKAVALNLSLATSVLPFSFPIFSNNVSPSYTFTASLFVILSTCVFVAVIHLHFHLPTSLVLAVCSSVHVYPISSVRFADYHERVQKISPTRFRLVASRLSNYSLTLYQLSYSEFRGQMPHRLMMEKTVQLDTSATSQNYSTRD